MKTRQIIIDNETFDITPSAVLLTIGAVAVEIEDGQAIVLASWYRRLQWDTGHRQLDRTVNQSTVDWWLDQSDAAFEEAVDDDGQRLPLWLAMHSLQAWLALNPYPIWGNGSDFDNAQLQHAFTQLGLRWPYWRNRCLRSLRGLVLDLYPDTQLPEFPSDKIKHHALHDAEHEADVLAALLRKMTSPKITMTDPFLGDPFFEIADVILSRTARRPQKMMIISTPNNRTSSLFELQFAAPQESEKHNAPTWDRPGSPYPADLVESDGGEA